MTPARQPHPQRCETCESFRWVPPAKPTGYCEWCFHEVQKDDICGCAPSHYTQSHTSPPVPDCDDAIIEAFVKGKVAGARAAREQVLDGIIAFRKRESKDYKIHDMWVYEAEYLESLRAHQDQR